MAISDHILVSQETLRSSQQSHTWLILRALWGYYRQSGVNILFGSKCKCNVFPVLQLKFIHQILNRITEK